MTASSRSGGAVTARGRLRVITWPGTPTTTELGGTVLTTTAFAPIPTVVTDRDGTEDLCAGSDRHTVADGRMALPLVQARAAQCDPLVESDLDAHFGGLTDDHSSRMVDEQSFPRAAPGWMSTPVKKRVTADAIRATSFRSWRHNQ